jgi:hypothetical protein
MTVSPIEEPTESKTTMYLNLRVEVSEEPDLKKIMAIASKIGIVRSLNYENYEY